MTEGLVSVIMPSYNTGRFIQESIQSVLQQTYKNWELLIVDDCSTDHTDEMARPFLADTRIKYFKNEKNSGAAISRNRALKEAKGEWIAFLDSDDLWEPNKLETQIRFMKTNGYAFSGTASQNIDEEGNLLHVVNKSPRHVSKAGMSLYCWPGCLTVMYHVPEIGVIQIADLKKNNDYAMWLKVTKKADFFFLDEVLSRYRVRQSSISHDKLRKLIASHYLLWRVGENKTRFVSVVLTLLNMIFGVAKKLLFVRTVN